MIHEQEVTLGTRPDLPTCSLQLKDGQAMAALCASDVQALLRCICEGTCVLHGQVEPFIWLIGRMVDRQRDAVASSIS